MTFIPENKLEELLIKVADTRGLNKEYETQFYKEFLSSDIFVLVNKEIGKEDGAKLIADNNTKIDFVARRINGKPCLPIFSSLIRLRAYIDTSRPLIKLNTKDLLESIDPQLTVMLNLNSEYGKEFTPSEVKRLLEAAIFENKKESNGN